MPTTTEERNAAVVRRFLDEVVNGGHAELIDEFFAPEYVLHGGALGDYDGLPAYKEFLAANGAGAFTGMHLDLQRVFADGEEVFVLFTNSGTNTGSFMGGEPTGNYAKWSGTALYRLVDGKVVESTYTEDILHMMLQLGVLKLGA